MTLISDRLGAIAKLYQIPNWDEVNEALLAEWIIDTYPTETLETILRVLSKPPIVGKTWRLTPDTIADWMGLELDRLASNRERVSQHPPEIGEPISELNGPDRYDELLKAIADSPGHVVRPMTDKEVKEEGQERPKHDGYTPPGKEYYVLNQLKLQYARECTDLITGRILKGKPNFDEWIKMQ